jgi:hypothetical protein
MNIKPGGRMIDRNAARRKGLESGFAWKLKHPQEGDRRGIELFAAWYRLKECVQDAIDPAALEDEWERKLAKLKRKFWKEELSSMQRIHGPGLTLRCSVNKFLKMPKGMPKLKLRDAIFYVLFPSADKAYVYKNGKAYWPASDEFWKGVNPRVNHNRRGVLYRDFLDGFIDAQADMQPGAMLQELREANLMSCDELAEKAALLTRIDVVHFELGERVPSREEAWLLSYALGYDVTGLFQLAREGGEAE